MIKKVIVLAVVLILTGCAPAEDREEGHSSMVVTANGDVVSAYRDGEDVTDERKALEVQTEEAISRFLNRNRESWSLLCSVCWKRME